MCILYSLFEEFIGLYNLVETLNDMIWLVIFIEHFWTVNTYENIALSRPAWQRHPYSGTPWAATLAVDGRQADLSARGRQCAISANGQSMAEWRVDLGEVRNLHHVFIQYRTENDAWDEDNYHTSRFMGFSIYVSNTTDNKDWVLCFKDNNYTRNTIPNPINVTCLIHGRYVIYYNNRTHRPFPAEYSPYAFNDLCEVEVYGCLTLGYYGENCSTPCPDNCKDDDCDIVDGTCVSCVPGYKESMCNKGCEGEYGVNCSKVCGACYEKEQCDYENGTCPNGCEDGYKGRQCTTVCSNNTYGPNCSMTCGHCLYLYGEKCNHVTGQCPRGCSTGFQGDLCIETRDEFKNKTTVAWWTYNAYGEPVSQTTVQVPFHSIITFVVLFSVSALLNLIFISRQVLVRCCNREENVDESVEKSSTVVNSIYVQEKGFSDYQELDHADQKVNYDIYISLE